MTTTDYIVNGLLVLLVLRQLQERRLDLRNLVLPVVLVLWAAGTYLKKIPGGGNDIALEVILGATGAALGGFAAWFTNLRVDDDGVAVSRAGAVAAVLWVLGIGARMGFIYASEHGAGNAIAHFSAAHQITGAEAWTAALVLMAFAEVLTRLAVLRLRAYRLTHASASGGGARAVGTGSAA